MLNAITIKVSKMLSHCAATVQMREESESGIRKWEEMWFKTTAEDGERGGSSDVWWKTVPQTSDCNRKRSVTDSGQTSTSSRDVDEAERSHRLASVSAGRHSSSQRYNGARPCWHLYAKTATLQVIRRVNVQNKYHQHAPNPSFMSCMKLPEAERHYLSDACSRGISVIIIIIISWRQRS